MIIINKIMMMIVLASAAVLSVHGGNWEDATLLYGEPTIDDPYGPYRDSAISMNDSGDAMAVWFEDGNYTTYVMASRYEKDTGWSTPVRISDAPDWYAYRPAIEMDNEGNAVAVWEEGNPSSSNSWTNRYDAVTGWGTSELLETEGYCSSQPKLDMNPLSGNAIVIWMENCATGHQLWGKNYDKTSGWGLPYAIQPEGDYNLGEYDLKMDRSDNAWAVVGENGWGPDPRIGIYRYTASAGWSGPDIVRYSPDYSYSFQIASSENGKAIVAWEENNTSVGFKTFVSTYDSVSGWDAPFELDTTGNWQSSIQMVMNASGTGAALWSKHDYSAGITKLYVRHFDAQSGWNDAAEAISEQHSYFLKAAIDGDGNIMTAYGYLNDVYSLYYDAGRGVWNPSVKISSETAPEIALEPAYFTKNIAVDAAGNFMSIWQQYTTYNPIYTWTNRYTRASALNPSIIMYLLQ